MTLDEWLTCASRDAERRDLADLAPLLEGLARATAVLRAADWNGDPTGLGGQQPRPDDA